MSLMENRITIEIHHTESTDKKKAGTWELYLYDRVTQRDIAFNMSEAIAKGVIDKFSLMPVHDRRYKGFSCWSSIPQPTIGTL